MRLKNIFSLACILFAAVSCSMEEELANVPTKGDDAAEASVAYLALNVNEQQALTKSGSSTLDNSIPDTGLTHCSFIVFNNDDANNPTIYNVRDGLVIDNGVIKTSTSATTPYMVQVKLGKQDASKTFQVVVVANSAAKYANCRNYDDVKDVSQGVVDMNTQVKVSDLTAITVINKHHASIAEASKAANVQSFAVTVKQLTARVKLTDFTVTFKEPTRPVDVRMANLKLERQHTGSRTILNDMSVATYTTAPWTNTDMPIATTADGNFAAIASKPVFNTFPNYGTLTAGKETALVFTLVYDSPANTAERTYKKDFRIVINRPAVDGEFTHNLGTQEHDYIKAGYEYQVKIKATLTSNLITCSAILCVKDWNEQTFEYVMDDVTPR